MSDLVDPRLRYPTLRHARQKRRSAVKPVMKTLFTTIAVVVIAALTVVSFALWDVARSFQPTVTLGNERVLAGVPDVASIPGGVNLLLIGSDSRQGQGAGFGEGQSDTEGILNDVTILLHISQDHTHAEVVSFPRDMLVPVPACDDPNNPGRTLSPLSSVKINTTLSYGSMPCVVKTVEQLTGLTIPFAAVVQFLGVAALSSAVGGVDVCVADPIQDPYTDTYLTAGEHTLQGIAALQFLRTRHGVGDGSDLGRISNQQVFMSSLARKLQSQGTLSDPAKLYTIAKVAAENMQLSSSLSDITRMISIAHALVTVNLSRLAFIQYPTSYVQGGGAVAPNASAQTLNALLQQDEPVTFRTNSVNPGWGSVASSSPPTATTTAPAATPTPAASGGLGGASSGASSTPTPTQASQDLPSNVSGQTADQTRCSSGRNGG